MTLKSNFEETPTLLAPPSYLDSTSETHLDSTAATHHRYSDIAPHYIAWKLILTQFLGSFQVTPLDDIDQEEDRATALLEVLCNLRLVSRLLYSVSMSLLRPMYFPDYLKEIQATVYSTNLSRQSLEHPRRETRVLDHYISYRINRRFLATRSSLLLNNDDLESDHRQVSQDLFKWLQPQTFIEDEIGKSLGQSSDSLHGVRFPDLLVKFRFTRAGITLPFRLDTSPAQLATSAPTIVRKECVVVDRPVNEPVFVTAHRLLDSLNRLALARKTHELKAWYEIVGQTD